MIVADTNLIAYFFLSGEHTAVAQQVFDRDPEWAAPVLWRSEFRNVLRLYLHKQLLAHAEAVFVAEQAEALMSGREYHPVAADVLSLAGAGDCSAYDCEFVSTASQLGVPLVTFDRRVARCFPGIAVSPAKFL